MTTRRPGLMVLLTAIVTLGPAGVAGAAPLPPALVCEGAKLTAAGKLEQCLVTERAKEVKGKVPNYAKCSATFTTACREGRVQGGAGGLPVGRRHGGHRDPDRRLLRRPQRGAGGHAEPALCAVRRRRAFPATGQTTCWNSAGTVIACAGTGQDGDIRAGATLSYTDNGDGTITDNNTGLMWEKKSRDGSVNTNIHDRTPCTRGTTPSRCTSPG